VDSFQQVGGSRHEYRLKGWQRGLYLVVGLFVGGIGAAIFYGSMTQPGQSFPALLMLIPLGIGAYLVALAVRSRLVIDGTRIEVRGAFREQSADLSEIEGYRTISTRNGSFWRLQLKDGRGSISIMQGFAGDDDLRAWFQRMTDLDERDRTAVLDEIAQQQDLGATPEDRLGALKQAKMWNIGLASVAGIAAAGIAFGPADAHLLAALVLALTPLTIMYLVHRQPLLYTMFKQKKDPRTDMSIAFMVPGFGLMLGNRGNEFVSMSGLMPYIALVTVACAVGLFGAARRSTQFAGVMVFVVLLGGMYGFGLAAAADTLADKSDAVSYSVTVTGKHMTSGKSTSYYLDLEPWGPYEGPNRVSVSGSVYGETSEGDTVCLALHEGALHVAWYRLVKCAM
jgi:hypothetical protein